MLPELKNALLARINRIPIVQTLELEIVRFGDGYCETRVPRKRKYDGVFDSFHGGLLMTLADSTACFAILTRSGQDTRLTTTDMNIRFLAPCLTDVTAKARVIKFGRTLCPVAIDLFDEQEQLVAVAQVNYILLSHPTHHPMGTVKMNTELDDLKQELAGKYIHDPYQKEIFLKKATQYKMWANYIAGLILAKEGSNEFHISDIRRVLKGLLGKLYDGPGAKESALLTADMADTSNWHFGCPCLQKVDGKRGYYKFIGYSISVD